MDWNSFLGHDRPRTWFRNAIQNNRLASTFLMVGPDGIGKRTFARLIAKTMLCTGSEPSAFAPCCRCEACAQIDASTHPDLIEIARRPDKTGLIMEQLVGEGERRARVWRFRKRRIDFNTGQKNKQASGQERRAALKGWDQSMINGPTRPRTLFNSSTYRLSRRRLLQAQPLAVLSLVLGMILGSNSANADKMLGLGVEVSTTVDDNVTRGYGDGNVLSDKFLGINISKGLHYPLSPRTRVAVLGFVGLSGYFEYTELTHYYAGAQGEFQYRPSGSFYAPTFALLVRTAIEEYQSEVRDS